MKTLILSIIGIILVFIANAQNVTIPDDNFKNALIEQGVDADEDGEISYAEAEGIISLIISGKNISDMTGIEAFIKLDTLICYDNSISSLDISSIPGIVYLNCGGSELAILDVTNNLLLQHLDCSDQEISILNVRHNPDLTHLNCHNNLISRISIQNNPKLVFLWCQENQLSSLDISNNSLLEEISLHSMPTLFEVCVWDNFSTGSINVDIDGSPNLYFTTECSATSSVAEKENSSIEYYPNPVTDQFTIKFDETVSVKTSISLLDITGKIMYSEILDQTVSSTYTINFSDFGEGIYFIHISNDQYSVTEKVIKVK